MPGDSSPREELAKLSARPVSKGHSPCPRFLPTPAYRVDTLLQTLKDGLTIGSLYALIALGYTMVYGILKFINFAHSDIVVLGGWLSLITATAIVEKLGLTPGQIPPWWVGPLVLLIAMVACGIIGFTIERLAYKPLRRAPRLNVLITAIGVSLFLQNTGQLQFVFGTRPRAIPQLLSDQTLLQIGNVHIRLLDLVGSARRWC